MLPSSEETQLGSEPLIAGPPVKTLSGNLRRGPWGGDHHWGWTSEALDIEPKSNQLWRSFALKEESRETAPEQHPLLPNTGWDNPELSGHGAPPVKRIIEAILSPKVFWPWWFLRACSSACLGSRTHLPVPSPLNLLFFRCQPQSQRGGPSCYRPPTPVLLQGAKEQEFHFDFLYPFSLSDAARKTCFIV